MRWRTRRRNRPIWPWSSATGVVSGRANRVTARACISKGRVGGETKNACLIRARRKAYEEDPQPDPPACFLESKHVAKIAETEALSVGGAGSE